MISKKLLTAIGMVLVTSTAIGIAVSNGRIIDFAKADVPPKEFVYDSTVSSQINYGGNSSTTVSYVNTGIGTPITTKLYREAGKSGDGVNLDGSGFFFARWCNQRTYAFEAGLNNLVGFEIQFKDSHRTERDNGEMDPLSCNLELTFYHNKEVVDTASFSESKVINNNVYTHTWNKGIEISEKIDYVKCSFNCGGGGNEDEGRSLTINYFKVCWSC